MNHLLEMAVAILFRKRSLADFMVELSLSFFLRNLLGNASSVHYSLVMVSSRFSRTRLTATQPANSDGVAMFSMAVTFAAVIPASFKAFAESDATD
jgi:hypothetical protein